MKPDFSNDLLQRYLQGNCSASEKTLVENWYARLEATGEHEWQHGEKEVFEQYLEKRLLDNIQHPQTKLAPVRRISYRRNWWVAASLLLVAGTGAYFLAMNKKPAVPVALVSPAVDIMPGKDGAVLTLSDGRQILLDSMGNGTIPLANGAVATIKDGQLSYANNDKAEGVTEWNTMQTPKGRQFVLRLPDGTRVWLNAASSVSYPTSFNGKERVVKVTGETYFEVAADKTKPFKVSVNEQAEVEVLGTHFNINAYSNASNIATTLLGGAVRVAVHGQGNVAKQAAMLQPGQQALIETAAEYSKAVRVTTLNDPAKVIAWKNGVFNFEGVTLKEMMQQIERWYDITVVFEKGVPDIRFEGKINRNVNLNGILKALDESGVHYRMGGNRQLVLLP